MSFDIKPPKKRPVQTPRLKARPVQAAKKAPAKLKAKPVIVKKAAPKKNTKPVKQSKPKQKRVKKRSRGPAIVLGLAILIAAFLGYGLFSGLFERLGFITQPTEQPPATSGVVSTFPSDIVDESEPEQLPEEPEVPKPAVVQKQEAFVAQLQATEQFTDAVVNYDTSLWEEISDYLDEY